MLLVSDMIGHANETVQNIGLEEYERMLKKNPQAAETVDQPMVLGLIKCLESKSTTIGTLAMKILAVVLDKHIEKADVKEALEKVAIHTDESKCRMYELLTKYARQSPDHLKRADFVLANIIEELARDDILMQLNIMEILSGLVETEHGLAYLEEKNLFQKLMVVLEDVDMMSIFFPGYNKFLGGVAHGHPEKIFTKYSHLCKPLFETIISNASDTLSPALDTLGLLGLSKEGKIGLSMLNYVSGDDDMMMAIMEMRMFLETLPTNEKIRVFGCMEMLLRWVPPTEGEEPDNRISTITQTWYKHFDRPGDCLQVLLENCRNPFPDMKMAALGVVKSIVAYKWGRKALAGTAGFLEYLVDRNAEFRPEALHTKFEILQQLDKHAGELSEAQQAEVRDYVVRGVFYKQGITEEVSTE